MVEIRLTKRYMHWPVGHVREVAPLLAKQLVNDGFAVLTEAGAIADAKQPMNRRATALSNKSMTAKG